MTYGLLILDSILFIPKPSVLFVWWNHPPCPPIKRTFLHVYAKCLSRIYCVMHNYTAVVVPGRVILAHNLGDSNVAYNTQRVTFICTIIVKDRDLVITWSSDEYIGTGGLVLQLTSADPPGFSVPNPRNPTTVATLLNTTRSSDGLITVTSSLQLVASAKYPTSSISCRANGPAGPVETVAFQTSMQSTSMPSISLNSLFVCSMSTDTIATLFQLFFN